MWINRTVDNFIRKERGEMAKSRIEYLSVSQKRHLQRCLQYPTNREKMLTLTELEGFFHAIAITPDMVKPSEWIPVIFGGDDPDIENEEKAKEFFTVLFDVYNTYKKARSKNKLRFPFNLEHFSREMIGEIYQWCYGFIEALSLRPDIWYLDHDLEDKTLNDLPETEQTIITSIATIGAFAYPENFIGQLVSAEGLEVGEIAEKIGEVLMNLPFAVEELQYYGEYLWNQELQEMRRGVFDFNQKKKKVGRNEPCPCGSGKKYKKCCGRN